MLHGIGGFIILLLFYYGIKSEARNEANRVCKQNKPYEDWFK